MDKWIKSAIVIACVAVALVAGLSIWDRYQSQQRSAALERSLQEARTQQHVNECKRYVEQWNSGQRSAVRSVFGSQSETAIRSCKFSIDLAGGADE